jgi:hypothetical protein
VKTIQLWAVERDKDTPSASPVEHPMKQNPNLIYEFAYHEGNYGMHNIMAGSRQEEREAGRTR